MPKFCQTETLTRDCLKDLLEFYNFLLSGGKNYKSIKSNLDKYCIITTVGNNPDAVYRNPDGTFTRVPYPGDAPTSPGGNYFDLFSFNTYLKDVYNPKLEAYNKALAIQKQQEQEMN